ncbi:MAG TPA: GDP-mannose 4,6-dehydratase [Fimbriimonadaceae bacterium]|nr:GDP-mannose 4,6-dehydratase [Fimbriimonadaceae bacterium]HRJ32439.1 GDP-mannose 4,6-dehydratase [Fimbriimonadaceae bacterium]
MRALITGGAGFIGSHLAESLAADGHEVWVLDDLSTGQRKNLCGLEHQPGFRFIEGSVLDEATVTDCLSSVDVVYHLAAVVGVRLVVESPVRTLETNLKGTENVLRACYERKLPVLLASTSEVYGRHLENRPLSEEDDRIYGPPTVGRWSYAASKAVDEFLGLAYHRERGLPVVIARFFNTVGPRQTGRYGMVLPSFVRAALQGKPLEIHGDGSQSRSFTWVGDCVRATRSLMQTPEAVGEVVNIGHGSEVTIAELARRVVAKTGSSSKVVHVTHESVYGPGFEDMQFRTPSIAKLQRLTGYAPSYDLDQILDEVIAYERAQESAPASAAAWVESTQPTLT